jgi:hypothetical protein
MLGEQLRSGIITVRAVSGGERHGHVEALGLDDRAPTVVTLHQRSETRMGSVAEARSAGISTHTPWPHEGIGS